MERFDESVDVLVVGARIGGVFAAGCLGQRGYSVLVVDKARFPSDTLSTHFCRGGGLLGVADRLGWLPDVEEVGAPKLSVEYSHSIDGVSVGPPQNPGDVGYCLAARRVSLDAALQRAVQRDARVEVRTRTAVEALIQEGDRVVGARLSDGAAVGARLVVGADGRRSRVARWVGALTRELHPGMRAVYFRYMSGFEPVPGHVRDGPEFAQNGDEMAYVFPSDAGLTCVALSVNLATFEEFRHDVETAWTAHLQRYPEVWARYACSTVESRMLAAAPQPDWVRQAAGPGWALVGDAAIHQDPWSGEGMDSAARQAEVLADAVKEAWVGGHDAWAGAFESRRDAELLDDFHSTVEGARDLSASAA